MTILQRGTAVLTSAALALVLGAGSVGLGAAAASTTSCATDWGSTANIRAPYTTRQVTDVRSGRHGCFDRLVLDVPGPGAGRPGFHVQYVRRVTADGSGAEVPLRGGARIQVIVHAPASDAAGHSTYQPRDWEELVDVTGYSTFRQVAWAGSFEGQTTIGLGVRARLPMRAFVLPLPGRGFRVVVDVAHHW